MIEHNSRDCAGMKNTMYDISSKIGINWYNIFIMFQIADLKLF